MTEMSGRFLQSGQELTTSAYEQEKQLRRIEQIEKQLVNCQKSLFWLGYALGLPTSFDFTGLLRKVEIEGSASLYHELQIIEKTGGGTRIIISPKPELMFVQKRIHHLLMDTFKRPPHAFGYRGGTCYEVAQRHADWPSTLKFDVRDAFFQVSWTKVRSAIRGYRSFPGSGFSGSIARWIAKLCTYAPPPTIVQERFPRVRSFLPQGAPTSPICFDLACAKLDRKLLRVAERVGGIVSRYADNYYFSMKTSRISPKLEHMIACDVEKHSRFQIHKVRRVNQGELCRILGYNIIDGRITNTRDFNRNLRGALHVLKTKLERGLEWRDDYARVSGFMGRVVNLPEGLAQTYAYCEATIEKLFSRGV